MKKPTKSDWGNIDNHNLDAQCSFDHFAGLSKGAARELFKDDALRYSEDLQSMPEKPFNFYVRVYAEYLLSNDALEDSDGASSFLHLIVTMLKNQRSLISPETLQILISTAKLVSSQQAAYDADYEIYGNFSELYTEIISLSKSTSL